MESNEDGNAMYIEEWAEHTPPLQSGVNILELLRDCSLIPSNLSEFQTFVSSLLSDPVSEAVIQGVWKQIYKIGDMSESHLNDDKSVDTDKKSEINFKNICSEKPSDISQLSSSKCKKEKKVSCQSNSESISNLMFVQNNISDEVILDDEDSSSDCEVVEVVSLKKVNSDSSGSEPSGSDNESESNTSVEILDELICPELKESSGDENSCPVHNKNSFYDSNVTQNCECPNCVSSNIQQPFKHMDSCAYAKQTDKLNNGCVKKNKKKKYRKLRTEVKCLKSLLVSLLENSYGAKRNNEDGRTGKLSSLSGVDLIHKVKKKSQKTVKKKASETECSKGDKKRRVCKEKLKEFKKKDLTVAYKNNNPAAFSTSIGSNTSDENTKSHERKPHTAGNTRNCHEFCKTSDRILDSEAPCSDVSRRRQRKFSWREVIVETLMSHPEKSMPVEELKRKVIAKYYCERGNMSKNTSIKFLKYLYSISGVVIDADVATYNNKQKLQVSSKSERKKHVVMKTITTTREYKMT